MWTWKKESGEFFTLLALLGWWGGHSLPPPQGKENFGQGKLPWDGMAGQLRCEKWCHQLLEKGGGKCGGVVPFLTVFESTYVALWPKNKCCSLEKHIIVWVIEVTGCSSQQGEWIHVVTESVNCSWQLPLKSGGARGPQNLKVWDIRAHQRVGGEGEFLGGIH